MSASQDLHAVVDTQQRYSSSHNVSDIFSKLTTAVVYTRPANPAAFLVEEVVRMQREGKNYSPIKVR